MSICTSKRDRLRWKLKAFKRVTERKSTQPRGNIYLSILAKSVKLDTKQTTAMHSTKHGYITWRHQNEVHAYENHAVIASLKPNNGLIFKHNSLCTADNFWRRFRNNIKYIWIWCRCAIICIPQIQEREKSD